MMLDAGGHEQNLGRRKVLSRSAANKFTAALGSDVNFVT